MNLRDVLHHSMRAYYIAIAAGAVMIVSAFLPLIRFDGSSIGGVPDAAGFWMLGFGVLAVVLAGLSVWTRKNSRHPLLVVGLAASALTFLGYQWLSRSVRETAWARSQAQAIVENVAPKAVPEAVVGLGLYLGLAAAIVLVLFGLTIVFKRVPSPYAAPDDDDI